MTIPPVPSGVYLRLFHGRTDPDQDLVDWGCEGPVIGPPAYLQVTYMCDVKFAAPPHVMELFFPDVIAEWRSRGLSNAGGPLCDWRLEIHGDLVLNDDVYYGDWSVTAEASPSPPLALVDVPSPKKKATRRWP